jgi:hypothetical protein
MNAKAQVEKVSLTWDFMVVPPSGSRLHGCSILIPVMRSGHVGLWCCPGDLTPSRGFMTEGRHGPINPNPVFMPGVTSGVLRGRLGERSFLGQASLQLVVDLLAGGLGTGWNSAGAKRIGWGSSAGGRARWRTDWSAQGLVVLALATKWNRAMPWRCERSSDKIRAQQNSM